MRSKHNQYNLLDRFILLALVLAVLIFILYPLVCIVIRSCFVDGRFTVEAYTSLFKENKNLLKNSIFVAVLSSALSTVLSMAIAICVRFANKKLKGIFMSIILISMVSPPFIAALSYIQLFGRRGLITHGLLGLSLNPYGWLGIVSMQTLFFSSLNALLLIGILERIDMNLLQASTDLGASRSYTLYKIVLPLIRPSLLICLLLSFIRSMADFGTPIVIGGRFETISTEIYMQVIGYSNLEKSSALNVILLIPTIVVFILYRWLMRRNDSLFTGNSNKMSGAEENYSLKGISALIVYPLSALFFGMMTLEYGSIFLTSFTKSIKGRMEFTLEHFYKLWETNMETFIRSIVYALIVGLVGTVIGILLAYYVERRKIKLGSILDFIVTMPYMLPGTCFGIGYILAFNSVPLKLTGTAAIVIINMIFKQLSITTKAVGASLTQISTNLDDAARDLGANRLLVFKDVLLPNLRNAFSVGFINNFTSAMITVGSVIFLVTPGQKIAVFTLFDSINSGRYGEASMISTFIIVITVLINWLFSNIFMEGRKKTHVPRVEHTI